MKASKTTTEDTLLKEFDELWKPRFRTPYDYVPTTSEQYQKPSMTIPNMALTIPEILIRFSQGQPLNIAQQVIYSGEHFIPNMSTYDIIDQQNIIKEHRANTEKLTKSYNDKMKARSERQQKQHEEQKAFKDFLDNVNNNERLDFYEYLNKRKNEQDKPATPTTGVI